MDCGKPDDEGNGGRCAYVAGFPAAEILREYRGGERSAAGLGKRCAENGAGLYYGEPAVYRGTHDGSSTKRGRKCYIFWLEKCRKPGLCFLLV